MGFCNFYMPGKGSDSIWFNICFPALHQLHRTKEGGKQPVSWPDCPLSGGLSSRPKLPRTPWCIRRGKVEREMAKPVVLSSHLSSSPVGHLLLRRAEQPSGYNWLFWDISAQLRCAWKSDPVDLPVCVRANYGPGSLVSLFCVDDAIWLIC